MKIIKFSNLLYVLIALMIILFFVGLINWQILIGAGVTLCFVGAFGAFEH